MRTSWTTARSLPMFGSTIEPSHRRPEWRDRSKAPFLNPRGFTSDEPFPPAADESEVEFSWSRNDQGQTALQVFIRGECHAMLAPGSKPGWCKLATKNGPLAFGSGVSLYT